MATSPSTIAVFTLLELGIKLSQAVRKCKRKLVFMERELQNLTFEITDFLHDVQSATFVPSDSPSTSPEVSKQSCQLKQCFNNSISIFNDLLRSITDLHKTCTGSNGLGDRMRQLRVSFQGSKHQAVAEYFRWRIHSQKTHMQIILNMYTLTSLKESFRLHHSDPQTEPRTIGSTQRFIDVAVSQIQLAQKDIRSLRKICRRAATEALLSPEQAMEELDAMQDHADDFLISNGFCAIRPSPSRAGRKPNTAVNNAVKYERFQAEDELSGYGLPRSKGEFSAPIMPLSTSIYIPNEPNASVQSRSEPQEPIQTSTMNNGDGGDRHLQDRDDVSVMGADELQMLSQAVQGVR